MWFFSSPPEGKPRFSEKLELELKITPVPLYTKDVKVGTLKSILKQAKLSIDVLKKYL